MVALDKFTVCSHLAPDLAVMLISGDKIEIHTKSNLSDFISGKQIRKMMQSFLTAALTDASLWFLTFLVKPNYFKQCFSSSF